MNKKIIARCAERIHDAHRTTITSKHSFNNFFKETFTNYRRPVYVRGSNIRALKTDTLSQRDIGGVDLDLTRIGKTVNMGQGPSSLTLDSEKARVRMRPVGTHTTPPINVLHSKYNLETFRRSNQDTCLTHKPSVKEGEWVQSGDLLTDCASSVGGELSLGQNLFVAYMPWEGYNFEDAILISERLVMDDLYTSVHIERYEIETTKKRTNEVDSKQKNKTQGGFRESKSGRASSNYEEITRDIPDVSEKEREKLDSHGIIKIGSWVEDGDILVGKITPINKKEISPYQKLLYTILEKQVRTHRDSSLRAPKGIKAKVIDIKYFLRSSASIRSLNYTSDSLIRRKEKQKRGLMLRSNINMRGAHPCKSSLLKKMNKNFSRTDPHGIGFFSIRQKSRSLLEKLFQKYNAVKGKTNGRLSFKNLGNHTRNVRLSDVETIHIYLAEKRKIQVGDKMAGRHGNKGIVSQILPIQDMPYLPDGTPLDIVLNPLGVPSRMNVGQIYECLLGLAGKYLGENYKVFSFDEMYGAEATRSFVFNKLYQARRQTGLNWLFDPNSPGKVRLYDGRTGECFDQSITVGQAYILRLVHMVDDKIHMRSTGPYSLVTQQPLRGRSKQGGQRLGEMEVWALEGYGAAFTLLEMLTIKSDDLTGRMTLWSNLILNKELSIGTPEAFKVLVCELQALCLDIGLFRYTSSGSNQLNSLDASSGQNPSQSSKSSQPITDSLTEMTHLMSFP